MALDPKVTGPAKAIRQYGPVAGQMANEEFAPYYDRIDSQTRSRVANSALFARIINEAVAPFVAEARANVAGGGSGWGLAQGLGSNEGLLFGAMAGNQGAASQNAVDALGRKGGVNAALANIDRVIFENQAAQERLKVDELKQARRNELLTWMVDQLFEVQNARFNQSRLAAMQDLDERAADRADAQLNMDRAKFRFDRKMAVKNFNEAVRQYEVEDQKPDFEVTARMGKGRNAILRDRRGRPILDEDGNKIRIRLPKGENKVKGDAGGDGKADAGGAGSERVEAIRELGVEASKWAVERWEVKIGESQGQYDYDNYVQSQSGGGEEDDTPWTTDPDQAVVGNNGEPLPYTGPGAPEGAYMRDEAKSGGGGETRTMTRSEWQRQISKDIRAVTSVNQLARMVAGYIKNGRVGLRMSAKKQQEMLINAVESATGIRVNGLFASRWLGLTSGKRIPNIDINDLLNPFSGMKVKNPQFPQSGQPGA